MRPNLRPDAQKLEMFATFKFHISPSNVELALYNISCNVYPFFKKKRKGILSFIQNIELIFIYIVMMN